jgi:hypothetical protein
LALFVLLLVVTTCCWVVAGNETALSPLQRVERLVAPITVKHPLETPRRVVLSVSADRPEIQVVRSSGRVELREGGGTSISGITSVNKIAVK